MYRKRIMIDLDGVLNDYNGEYLSNKISPAKQGSEDFLEQLACDADLYLFTTREIALARDWLVQYNLDKYFKDVTNTKLKAHIYIDDRALKFEGNYSQTLEEVKKFEVYWKN